jgi:hypothetical protein
MPDVSEFSENNSLSFFRPTLSCGSDRSFVSVLGLTSCDERSDSLIEGSTMDECQVGIGMDVIEEGLEMSIEFARLIQDVVVSDVASQFTKIKKISDSLRHRLGG